MDNTSEKIAGASTPQYTISKYPNNSGVGIFDLNRIFYNKSEYVKKTQKI
jgi:hypothetical protein